MTELNKFLADQSGAQSEEGEFTFNPDRAMELLGGLSSDKPFWYFASLLEALYNEVSSIEIFVERREVKIVAFLKLQSELRDGRAVLQNLGKPSQTGSMGAFCRALLGCRAESPERFTVGTATGTLTLHGQPEFNQSRQSLQGLVWRVRYSWGWMEAITRRSNLLSALRHFARFYPEEIVIDGCPPARDWPLATVSICCEEYCGRGSVGFRSPDLSVYKEVEEGLHLYQKGKPATKTHLPLACTIKTRDLPAANFHSVLSFTNFSYCRFFLVRWGVLVETLTWSGLLSGLELAELGLHVAVDLSDFKVDVSGLTFVRDEHLAERLRDIFEQAGTLNLAYARHADPSRTARLKRQKGAILGFVSGVLAGTSLSHLSREKAEERDELLKKALSQDWNDIWEWCRTGQHVN